jgi:tetratricopeptide (TPR) repeat protein
MYSQEESLSSVDRKTIFSALVSQCKSCSAFYAYFHVFFLSFLALQLVSFLLFFSYFSRSIACAFAIALFFLTAFSYFVLLSFFKIKKPQQIISIRESFIEGCHNLDFLQTARIALQGICILEKEEHLFYAKEAIFSALTPLFSKCKVRLHWKNFLIIKEAFFFLSFNKAISHIEQNPLDLEAHTLLSEIYFAWSLLYLPPEKPLAWIPEEYFSSHMREKFLACSSRAVEECTILKEYGTSNRWLLLQLAKIYELREDIAKQTEQYEELRALFPEDIGILAELGVLYFIQGEHVKGLKIYEMIKDSDPQKATEVLSKYAFAPIEAAIS